MNRSPSTVIVAPAIDWIWSVNEAVTWGMKVEVAWLKSAGRSTTAGSIRRADWTLASAALTRAVVSAVCPRKSVTSAAPIEAMPITSPTIPAVMTR